VDRRVEAEAVGLASKLGIGPELVYAEHDGVLLTCWVDGTPLSAGRLRSDPQAIRRLADTLQALHGSGHPLGRRFAIFEMIDGYRRDVPHVDRKPDFWSPRLNRVFETARKNLTKPSVPLVPSHCDLIPANCLDDGSCTMLIDWEYAGMNDPAWDLAYMALEGELGAAQQDSLLRSYGIGWVSPGRLQIFMLLCAAMNYAWARSRPGAGRRVGTAWAKQQLETAERIAHTPPVDSWLASL
jgi:thiamine kinase-like enzyme